MYRPSLVLSYLLVVVFTVQATYYCDNSVCQPGEQHVACGSGQFAYACPANAELVPIPPNVQNAMIALFNEKRNFIAGGGDPKHDKACRMATMQWNNDLANIAAYNVKKCEMEHDSCRNTKTFRWTGQNLAWMGYNGEANSTEKLLRAIDMWYSEIKDSNRNYMKSYPIYYNGPVIGHFAAMMSDSNTHVGCAASTYQKTTDWFKTFLVACNFAFFNFINYPIYAACPQAGSKCRTGLNYAYRNLCSTAETYSYP